VLAIDCLWPRSVLLVGMAVCCLGSAVAQSRPAMPTAAEIERAAKTQPVITEREVEQAAKKHRMPTEAELVRVPIPSTPRIDALPQPQVQRTIDLGAIAQGYEAIGSPNPSPSGLKTGPTLLVFVSFAMPEPTLQRLVGQAAASRLCGWVTSRNRRAGAAFDWSTQSWLSDRPPGF
jgi:conjugal transfer pilus assembly protein TrbC